MQRVLAVLFFFIIVFCIFVPRLEACSASGCTLANLGKDRSVVRSESENRKFYFQYLFDQVHWDMMDAREAHNIHHGGHEFHDKISEDFHHFKIGSHMTKKLNLALDIPYVIRRSLEVEDHALLGIKQRSEGWGDLQLLVDYLVWEEGKQSLKAVTGVQFPTGATKEKNTQGDRFEPELQPGLGAYQYILGGIYQMHFKRADLILNTSYVLTTRGAQEFQTGNILTISGEYDYWLNPNSKHCKTSLGVDTVYNLEAKDRVDGVTSQDSGGQLLLAGPVVKMDTGAGLDLIGSVLFPMYQQLGGVHQELAYEWTLAAKVRF